jgi:hypothetical protein
MLMDTPMRLVSSFKILNFGGARQNMNTIKVVHRRSAGQCWRIRDFSFDEVSLSRLTTHNKKETRIK